MQPGVEASTPTRLATEHEELSLLHLPDELLLQIIDELHPDDLYTISMLCSRLHRLALPAYFSRHGITRPLDSTHDHLILAGAQLNALPGLQHAPFVKNIRCLSCEIGPVEFGDELGVIIRRLHRLVLNIDGLSDLTLDFDRCDLELLSLDEDGDSAKSWVEACNRLLTTAVERCTSLMLIHREVGEESSQVHLIEREAAKWRHIPSLFTRPFKALKRGLSRRASSFSPRPMPVKAGRTSSNLKTLFLHATTFLLPPHSGWAFLTLNSAPLTELYLVEVELSTLTSALIFRCINIPTLEHLCITACVFPFSDFAKFLSRHSSILTLDIMAYHIPQCLPSLPRSTLPRLMALHSSADNIAHLLKPRAAFPRLAEVRVLVLLHMEDSFNFLTVENSLARVAKRLKGTYIGLDVFPLSRSDNWVDLEGASDVETYPVLRWVRSVAFGVPRPDTAATGVIPTWLSMFPLLEHIEFLNAPIGLDHEAKMALLQQISQKCAGLRFVKIGEETRTVSAWLSRDN